MGDAADHPAIGNSRNAARIGRKIGLKPSSWALVSQKSFVIDSLPIVGDLNHSDASKGIPFMGPDPSAPARRLVMQRFDGTLRSLRADVSLEERVVEHVDVAFSSRSVEMWCRACGAGPLWV